MKLSIPTGFVAATILALAFVSPAPAAFDAAHAKEIIKSQGCLGCHRIAGSGGTFGPALDGVGKRLSAKQIRTKLLDPKSSNPNSAMPSFGQLPAKDLAAVVEYLEQLK